MMVSATYIRQFLNAWLVVFFRQISNEIADLRQRVWQWIQVHSSMNADSKASIRFEAFFFDVEDRGKNDTVSLNATVKYRSVPLRWWERTPKRFKTVFENVLKCPIYLEHAREPDDDNCVVAGVRRSDKAERGCRSTQTGHIVFRTKITFFL